LLNGLIDCFLCQTWFGAIAFFIANRVRPRFALPAFPFIGFRADFASLISTLVLLIDGVAEWSSDVAVAAADAVVCVDETAVGDGASSGTCFPGIACCYISL
jgi:hypothetical protein